MFDLTGKAAFVTGASRGIGRSVAACLARAGADVALLGRDAAALDETLAAVKATGRRALALTADVTSGESVEAAVAAACREFTKLDILVCNAGIQKLKPFLEMTPQDWRGLIATNLEGAIVTLQSVGRRMVAQKSGAVIAMASIYGFIGAPGNSIYCMTKGGLLQLSRALAVEWARYNVRVNAICPGWIETDLTRPYMQDQKTTDAALRRIPLRRFGKPEDIGPLAVYLASDEASFVTGQAYVIDGGQIAR
ncbi:MAG: SDR family oxidoreductase [Betaproteobacteria bacterium]|nr:SDR family oxidoreductase [Betaproteobacteria bacterium]